MCVCGGGVVSAWPGATTPPAPEGVCLQLGTPWPGPDVWWPPSGAPSLPVCLSPRIPAHPGAAHECRVSTSPAWGVCGAGAH